MPRSVEVEAVSEDSQVSHAAGGREDLLFGLGELLGHHVVLAGVVAGAVIAGSGVLAVSGTLLGNSSRSFRMSSTCWRASRSASMISSSGTLESISAGCLYAQLGSREGSCQWSSGVSRSAAAPSTLVEYHQARCDAVAGPDGGVFWVGFVNVGEYFG